MSNFYGSYVGFGAGTSGAAAFHGSGVNFGYGLGTAPGPYTNDIQKFSFTSATDAVDVGDLTVGRGFTGGCSSATYAYCCGGGYPTSDVVDKVAFVSGTDAADVGNLTGGRADPCCTSSTTQGFSAGGYPYTAAIDKFDFASDGNATGHGNLSRTTAVGNPMFSVTNGYCSGGSGPASTQRDRYAFASNTTAVDDGDVSGGNLSYGAGCTNATHGFNVGGGSSDTLDRVAFATGGTASDWGDLSSGGDGRVVCSQTDYGYCGGSSSDQNRIERFAFASDAGGVDTGANMLSINSTNQSYGYMAGCQY